MLVAKKKKKGRQVRSSYAAPFLGVTDKRGSLAVMNEGDVY